MVNTYTLRIDPNGGYRVSDNSTDIIEVAKAYGSTETVTERARTGYTLTGYVISRTSDGSTATANIGGATITFDSSTKTAEFTQGSVACTITAQWTANTYTITFNRNYTSTDTTVLTTKTFTYGSTTNTLAGAYSRAGYNFLGWDTDRSRTTARYSANQNVGDTFYPGATLYAIWTAKTYTVTFIYGSYIKNITMTYGSTQNITYDFNAYMTEGRRHIGWNANSSATTAQTSRPEANYKSTATFSFTLTTATADFGTSGVDGTTAKVYGISQASKIWVKYYTSASSWTSSTEVALDTAPRGVESFGSIITTYAGADIKVLISTTVGGNYSTKNISGTATITGASNVTLTFASANRLFTATTMNIKNITLSGDVCLTVASGKTLNIGDSTATTNTTVISGAAPGTTSNTTKSIFVVDGGTLNINRTSITGYTVGVASGNGGIIYATNSAKVTASYLTVSGGTANGKCLFYVNSSTMSVSNCDITVGTVTTASSFNGIFYNEKSTLTLTNGTINANNTRVVYEVGDTTTATTTITGTTIIGSVS